MIERLRQIEQNLNQALHLRCGKQVHAARDVRDALARIVNDDRDEIA